MRGRWAGWASALAGGAWLAVQAIADRWTWSQWIYWIPGWTAAAGAALAITVLRRRASSGIARTAGISIAWAVVAVGGIRFLREDVGWRPSAVPEGGAVAVTHWNARWPGRAALQAGRELARSLGDVSVISSPGSMLRGAVAAEWVPDGFVRRDLGIFGIVSRWPVTAARILGSAGLGVHGTIWLGWFEVSLPSGDCLAIMAIDLPSDPLLARGEIAIALRELLASCPPPGPADVLVGDLNCTPGSVVCAELPRELDAPPPWKSSGWLGTYPAAMPLLRIDTMRVGGRWRWHRYSTVAVSASPHRLQGGWIVPRGSPD